MLYFSLPYSGKLSREKTFTNFAVLWLFVTGPAQHCPLLLMKQVSVIPGYHFLSSFLLKVLPYTWHCSIADSTPTLLRNCVKLMLLICVTTVCNWSTLILFRRLFLGLPLVVVSNKKRCNSQTLHKVAQPFGAAVVTFPVVVCWQHVVTTLQHCNIASVKCLIA